MASFCSRVIVLLSAILSSAPLIKTITPALILTPAIKEGRIQEARESSKVNPKYFLNVSSHSGFLTVDEKYNTNLFFWYFPVDHKNGTHSSPTPWIIWLQGGPGASSLAGVFDEMGPFAYNKGKLTLEAREDTWCKDYSMLFIDNPVGAGYSFTDSEDGYATSMDMYSGHLYEALQQFLKVFPELLKAPLYLAGESYAGHFVPAFAQKIIDKTSLRADKDKIKLEGIMLGNPVLERESIADHYSSMYYQWGLIDAQGLSAARAHQDAHSEAVRGGDATAAAATRNALLDELNAISQQPQEYNILHDEYSLRDFVDFISEERIREAMHVGLVRFTFSNHTAVRRLGDEFLAHMRPFVESLLERYRVLIYCGQLDLVVPCTPSAEARRKNWRWSKKDAFLQAPRDPWWFNESIAGYVKSGGGLTEVLVRGAGHLVPLDKPPQAHQLISYFIRGLDLPRPPNYVPMKPPDYIPIETPVYKEASPSVDDSPNSYKSVFIASAVGNVLLLAGVVTGAVLYRIKLKRDEGWMYSDSVPNSDSVLNLA